MKPDQIKILADENISPKVVSHLRTIGIDISDVKEQKLFGKEDEFLLDLAYREKRFVLTHDSDFGTLAVNQNKPCYGIVYLRLKNLQHRNVSQICEKLFQNEIEISPETILVVEESRIRIRHLIDPESIAPK